MRGRRQPPENTGSPGRRPRPSEFGSDHETRASTRALELGFKTPGFFSFFFKNLKPQKPNLVFKGFFLFCVGLIL